MKEVLGDERWRLKGDRATYNVWALMDAIG
jgi:hypothetical protein